jgi:myosin heavy subunit
MIDEEMIVPQGSDQTLCSKLHQQHAKNKNFVPHTSRQVQKTLLFGVKHFAGPVSYDCLSKFIHPSALSVEKSIHSRFSGKKS